jgi:hypothetical protein
MQFGLIINEHKTKYFRCTKKNYAMNGININSMHLEQVKSFKYLGSIVNGNNSIEEEIKERIIFGNEAYYANQALFKSKLLSKKTELKIYWTLVGSVITYACETWVLQEAIK